MKKARRFLGDAAKRKVAVLVAITLLITQRQELIVFSSSSDLSSSQEIQMSYHEGPQDNQTIYIIKGSGMGSQIMNLLAHKVYFNDNGRHFIVDESRYGYRWDQDTGLLTGFFRPRFDVIDNANDYKDIEKHYRYSSPVIGDNNSTQWNYGKLAHGGILPSPKAPAFLIDQLNDPTTPLIVLPLTEYVRNNIKRTYGKASPYLYKRMAQEACDNLQFNNQAQQAIQALKDRHGIPDLKHRHSVGFHIRRGDKLQNGESKYYSSASYVDKLLHIAAEAASTIEHCFVSTDDYGAFQAVTKAVKESPRINCTVHTLTQRSQKGARMAHTHTSRNSTIQFLGELSLLTDATYFIGTFGSNVGALVALLRSCVEIGDTKHPFSHSYDVDKAVWHFF